MKKIPSKTWNSIKGRGRPRRAKVRSLVGNGRCNIVPNSSLRKRMRAARRGLFPVTVPSQKAMMRHKWYKKKMQALLGELSS